MFGSNALFTPLMTVAGSLGIPLGGVLSAMVAGGTYGVLRLSLCFVLFHLAFGFLKLALPSASSAAVVSSYLRIPGLLLFVMVIYPLIPESGLEAYNLVVLWSEPVLLLVQAYQLNRLFRWTSYNIVTSEIQDSHPLVVKSTVVGLSIAAYYYAFSTFWGLATGTPRQLAQWEAIILGGVVIGIVVFTVAVMVIEVGIISDAAFAAMFVAYILSALVASSALVGPAATPLESPFDSTESQDSYDLLSSAASVGKGVLGWSWDSIRSFWTTSASSSSTSNLPPLTGQNAIVAALLDQMTAGAFWLELTLSVITLLSLPLNDVLEDKEVKWYNAITQAAYDAKGAQVSFLQGWLVMALTRLLLVVSNSIEAPSPVGPRLIQLLFTVVLQGGLLYRDWEEDSGHLKWD